jgi:hypothetical protein
LIDHPDSCRIFGRSPTDQSRQFWCGYKFGHYSCRSRQICGSYWIC